MDFRQLATDIRGFVRQAYPNMEVRVEALANDPSRAAVYFTEAQFAALYPMQRYHYLRHLIPADYYERHLVDSEWFELAPGEHPDDLEYPDSELVDEITPNVMRCLVAARAFEALDDVLCPADGSRARQRCQGDYRHARAVFLERGFREDELFDVFHVLMARGGYCDCEILLNAVDHSRLRTEYWQGRAREADGQGQHGRPWE